MNKILVLKHDVVTMISQTTRIRNLLLFVYGLELNSRVENALSYLRSLSGYIDYCIDEGIDPNLHPEVEKKLDSIKTAIYEKFRAIPDNDIGY